MANEYSVNPTGKSTTFWDLAYDMKANVQDILPETTIALISIAA
jgi:hypothetical protein